MTRKILLLVSLILVVAGASVGPLMPQSAQAGYSEKVTFADFSRINTPLRALGIKAKLLKMEYVTAPGSGQYGATVFAKDVGNKQLDAHWVPFDPERGGSRTITYIQDTAEAAANGGVSGAQTASAIDRAMATWDSQTCATIPIIKGVFPAGTPPMDLGVVQYIMGYGGLAGWYADITHAGWLGRAFFDELAEGGGDYILGVTFTFVWVDNNGDPVDTNRDRKDDVAFREIYYNNSFLWSVQGPGPYDPEFDVETVALHESGHGLSQGHFGQIFNDGYGTKAPGFQPAHLHFAPEAVMNAVVWGTKRALMNTDIGGYCSIWASWPMK